MGPDGPNAPPETPKPPTDAAPLDAWQIGGAIAPQLDRRPYALSSLGGFGAQGTPNPPRDGDSGLPWQIGGMPPARPPRASHGSRGPSWGSWATRMVGWVTFGGGRGVGGGAGAQHSRPRGIPGRPSSEHPGMSLGPRESGWVSPTPPAESGLRWGPSRELRPPRRQPDPAFVGAEPGVASPTPPAGPGLRWSRAGVASPTPPGEPGLRWGPGA